MITFNKYYIYIISADIWDIWIFLLPNISIGIGLKSPISVEPFTALSCCYPQCECLSSSKWTSSDSAAVTEVMVSLCISCCGYTHTHTHTHSCMHVYAFPGKDIKLQINVTSTGLNLCECGFFVQVSKANIMMHLAGVHIMLRALHVTAQCLYKPVYVKNTLWLKCVHKFSVWSWRIKGVSASNPEAGSRKLWDNSI